MWLHTHTCTRTRTRTRTRFMHKIIIRVDSTPQNWGAALSRF